MPPKSKKSSPWMKCVNCDVDVSIKEMINHSNTSCPSTPESWAIPFIQDETLYTYLEINECEEQLRIGSRASQNTIFINQASIQMCNVAIGDSVIIQDIDKKLPCFVRSVWPISRECATSVILPLKSMEASWLGQQTKTKVSIQTIRWTPYPAASVSVTCVDKSVSDNAAFLQFVQSTQANKIINTLSSFQVTFYGKIVKLFVSKIAHNGHERCTPEWFLVTENTQWTCASEVLDVKPKNVICIGGVNKILSDILDIAKLCLGNSQDECNIKLIKSVLLYGPSGTGKSLISKYIAAQCEANIVRVNATEIYSKFYGETEAALKKLFSEATKQSPSIILIDEIDTLCPKKSSISEQEKRIISTMATLLDKLHDTNSRVFILATSNKPDVLDPILRRYGRIDHEIEIPIPDRISRRDILSKILCSVNHDLSNEDIEAVADVAHGFVGADIANLCTQASMHMLNSPKRESLKLQLSHFQWAIQQVKPSSMREVLIDIPDVKWSDIGGQDYLKLKLKQAIEWPLKYADRFLHLGIKPPTGVLMYGPPGCSKTMIAKALANESQLNFLSIKGPELFSKWVGESERAVRELFRKARQVAPSIIFFDEIDALGSERSKNNSGSNVQERVLAQILTELDGISPLGNVTIVAATNRPDKMDSALLRPGRLDRIVYVPLPSKETRMAIFKLKLSKMSLASDVDVDLLINSTEGYSGAEVQAVCHEAALKALEDDIQCLEVKQQHFDVALKIIQPRTPASLLTLYDNFESSHLR